MQMTKKSNYIFWVLVILGCIVRIVVIHNRDLFIDEVYYWRVSRMNNWVNLILINHWIKDHGILYYLWLKPLIRIIPDITTLRYSNLFLYVVSSISIYRLLKRKNVFIGLLGVAIFSFHRYFIYLSSTLTPYNLVFSLTAISIVSLFSFSQGSSNFRKGIIALFVCSTVLASYTDYSFYFTVPFYLLFFLFHILSREVKKDEKILLAITYITTLVLIVPGIYQFIHNNSSINTLFSGRYFEYSFFRFLYTLGGMLFFRAMPTVGLMVMLVPILYIFISKKKEELFYGSVYLGLILLLFFTQRYFFPLFAERYLWFLYCIYIMMILGFLKVRNIWNIGIVTLFIVFSFINFIIPISKSFKAPGDISYEIKYSTLFNNEYHSQFNTVIVLDRTSASDVLTRYYFSPQYPLSDRYVQEINNLKKRIVILPSKTDDISNDVKKLMMKKDRTCVLYYISRIENSILSDKTVKQLACSKTYYLDNMYGYVDSFKQINVMN